MTPTVVAGIDELLNEKWGEYFTFDRKLAKEKGIVVLCWSRTGAALPLNIEISEDALEKGRINWRELHRKIKLCLPDNLMKQRISEANTFMRDANRRNLKEVERDFYRWYEQTASDVRNIFGPEAYQEFTTEIQNIAEKKGSIQALHALVKNKIDLLKGF